jgi:hypothetical protein
LLVACHEYKEPAPSTRRDASRSTSARTDQGGVDKVESAPARSAKQTAGASASKPAADAGQRQQTGEAGKRAAGGSGGKSAQMAMAMTRDAGADRSKPSEATDAGKKAEVDAARAMDMGSAPNADDAGTQAKREQNTGSCCATSTQPGCGNAALRACVCEREPRCCSDAWDANCTRLVKEKHCQSGVRDCVCGFGEGQWQQANCCQGGWNDTCESVSYNKCGATADCP